MSERWKGKPPETATEIADEIARRRKIGRAEQLYGNLDCATRTGTPDELVAAVEAELREIGRSAGKEIPDE